MRLIKTGPYIPGEEKLEIIQKWGADIPAYAILSHTWSSNAEDEVLLADVLNGTSRQKPGFSKLWRAIERARLDGYGWLWDDTCCIDKTSSVELSEAINSMYSYYKNAEKCYAYLVDVSSTEVQGEFIRSRWWRRGWTLQELLAPTDLEFFNSDWQSLGKKAGLHDVIYQITGIETEYLDGSLPVEHASVAKRMFWASARQTTRQEDMAYCLLGLFEVNMSMLYGEGAQRAFLRLQEEIMRVSEDQSIFAWVKSKNEQNPATHHGLLADSPKDFEHTGFSIPYTAVGDYSPSTMTARGLQITLPLARRPDDTFIAALRCPVPGRNYSDWLALYLEKLNTGSNIYARVDCQTLASVSVLGTPQDVYVRQNFPSVAIQAIYPNHFFQIRSLTCNTDYKDISSYRIVNAIASEACKDKALPNVERLPWSALPTIYGVHKQAGALSVAIFLQRSGDGEAFVLLLGTSTKSDLDVGFDVFDGDFAFDKLQTVFEPRGAGHLRELQYHHVHVNVEERVHENFKTYLIDVDIRPISLPPTAADMFQDVADIIAGPDTVASKAALKDKVRRFWR